METITLQYDASIPGLKSLMASLAKLEGVTKVKTSKADAPDYAPEMVAKVKRGQDAFRRGDYKIIKTEDLLK